MKSLSIFMRAVISLALGSVIVFLNYLAFAFIFGDYNMSKWMVIDTLDFSGGARFLFLLIAGATSVGAVVWFNIWSEDPDSSKLWRL